MRSGWTLVEILVVIAILLVIATLVGLGGSAAMRRSKETACLNNLKQIHAGTMLYLADNDEYFPPYPWITKTNGFQEIEDNISAYWQALEPYKVTEAQRFCPLDGHAKTNTRGEWHSFRQTSYHIPLGFYIHDRRLNGVNISSIRFFDPSKTVYMVDQSVSAIGDSGEVLTTGHGAFFQGIHVDGSTFKRPVSQPNQM